MSPDGSPPLVHVQLKTLIEASPIPTAVSHYDGTILYANRSFARVFGKTLNEVIGSLVADYYYDPSDLEAVVNALNRYGELHDFEIKAKKKNGSPVWTQVSIAQLVLAHETLTLIQFSDITRRKHAETSLIQRTRSLEALNQLAREVMSTLDLEPILHTAVKFATQLLDVTSAYLNSWHEENQTLQVIAEYYSRDASAAERVSDFGVPYDMEADFGLSTSWMYDSQSYNLSHIDSPDITEEERAHLASFGGKTVLEVPLRTQDKPVGTLELWESRRKREFTAEEIDLVQAIARQVAMAIDNARLYERATEANRLKTEFLAKVSHELRTPLGVIMGYAEMLDEGMYGAVSAEQRKAIRQVVKHTDVLTQQVNDLLDAARLEAGKLHLARTTFILQELITHVCEWFTPQVEAKGLSFEVEMPDEQHKLQGDSTRIAQILHNLLRNALKFTEDGRITLTVYQQDTAVWVFTVTDSGSGIPQDVRATIFEAFRQADDKITRSYSGAGLGLAIVRQLAQLMGGDIQLESQVGQGSCFTVSLPLMTVTAP